MVAVGCCSTDTAAMVRRDFKPRHARNSVRIVHTLSSLPIAFKIILEYQREKHEPGQCSRKKIYFTGL